MSSSQNTFMKNLHSQELAYSEFTVILILCFKDYTAVPALTTRLTLHLSLPSHLCRHNNHDQTGE
jgi:hypothetical protein